MSDASNLIIRGARVIDPSQGVDREADVLVEDAKISGIEKPGSITDRPGFHVIHARDMWVIPGLIDMHVHLREPGFEYKESIESGTHAAVAGGFTSVACMANTDPINDNPYVTAFIREKSRQKGRCRVYPIGAVSKGQRGEELAEIGGMVSEGAVAISDDGKPVMNSYLMRKAMDYAKAFGIVVISHAEDQSLVGLGAMNESALSNALGLRGVPAAAEEIMVARDVALCRLTHCPTHIAHVSTEVAVEHIRRAKDQGLPITAEVAPHHLVFTENDVRTYDTRFKVQPPLRSEADRVAVIKALSEGVIDAIASDHAPHGTIDKVTEFDHAACGLIGLQTTLGATLKLVHDGRLSLGRWLEALTVKPAKILGIEAGTLKKGAVADLTILDPSEEWFFTEKDVVSKSLNSPFFGMSFRGAVKYTVVGGQIANHAQSRRSRT